MFINVACIIWAFSLMRFSMFLQIALVAARPAADIARKLLRLHVHAIHVPLKIARLQKTLVTILALERLF